VTQPDPSTAGIEAALDAIGATANGQGFDEYRFAQLQQQLDRHAARIVELHERAAAAEERLQIVDGINSHLDALVDRLRELSSRVTALEDAAKPAKRDRDDLNDRIVALLESAPTLKFSAISVDENLGGTGKDISDRLKTLAKNGRILIHAEEGRRPFYQALPPKDTQPS